MPLGEGLLVHSFGYSSHHLHKAQAATRHSARVDCLNLQPQGVMATHTSLYQGPLLPRHFQQQVLGEPGREPGVGGVHAPQNLLVYVVEHAVLAFLQPAQLERALP
jgi:hypothetical protein